MKNIILVFLTLAITMMGCREDISLTDEVVILLPTGEDVSTTVNGFVSDEFGRPLSNVEIQVGETSVLSNDLGFFYLPDLDVDNMGFAIKASKYQYITNIVRTIPKADADTYHQIVLSYSTPFSHINSDEGGVVADSFKVVEISIEPNSMENEDGSPYEGRISASINFYDPTSTNTLRTMPGNLEGFDKDGERVVLGTYGMFSAEFFGENGEDLNLKPGATAKVNMKIDPEMLDAAPQTIPTWSLDEEFGIWLEEGSAEKLDGSYSFDVSHFSFWNCDIRLPLTCLEGKVIDQHGFPMGNTLISLTFNRGNDFISGCGYTNSRGEFSGKVPRDVEFQVTIIDELCAYGQARDIGPFTTETANVTIDIVIPEETYEVKGRLVDCNLEPVSNGAAFITVGNDKYTRVAMTDAEGNFSMNSVCANEYTMSFFDLDQLKTAEQPIGVFENLDLLDIQVCENIMNYVIITSDVGNKTFVNPQADYSPEGLSIFEENQQEYFNIYVPIPTVGVNSDFSIIATLSEETLRCSNAVEHVICDEAVTFTIFEINEAQRIITGKIEGELYTGNLEVEPETNSHAVSINFRVQY